MTVVVGVDGLPDSYAAIRLAQKEAACRGTDLTAVMAYTSDTALGTPAVRPLAAPLAPDEQREIAESTLRQAVREALGSDEGVTLRALPGMPGRVLVQMAQTVKADLMVLATRGNTRHPGCSARSASTCSGTRPALSWSSLSRGRNRRLRA